MGWSLGYDGDRYIGYGVPAYCDHPRCTEEIDRGLAYICADQMVGGGERGCGLFFCEKHRYSNRRRYGCCSRCANNRAPFDKKADHPRWVYHMLHDYSWAEWRAEHPEKLLAMRVAIGKYEPPAGHDTRETAPPEDEEEIRIAPNSGTLGSPRGE